MKASKKLLSLLLVLTMVFSFAAISASAEGFVIQGRTAPEQQTSQNDDNSNQQDATIVGENDNAADGEKNETSADTSTEDDKADDADKQDEPEVADPVAIIVGSKKTYKYATLQEAIAAAAEGATVQLVKDITLSAPLTISKNLKLDLTKLNGTPSAITFANSSTVYDAALVVDSGAVVTIKEGELSFVVDADEDGNEFGFVNGVYAEDGSVTFINMVVGGAVVGGKVLSNAADGSINLKDNCALDFDPSAYVGEGYRVEEYDGMFAVLPDDSNGDDDTPSTNEIKPNQDGDVVLSANGTTAAAKVENVTTATTLNLNGKTLTGDITVASGATLRIINSGELDSNGKATALADATLDGKIVLDGGNLIIENNVTVTGDITLKANSGLVIKDSAVTVTGGLKLASGVTADKIDGLVTAGKFGTDATNSAAVLNALMPKDSAGNATHEIGTNGIVSEKAPASSTDPTVTDASDNTFNTTNNYPQYFKGKTELASQQTIVRLDSTVFHLSAKPDKVMIDTAEVAPTGYYTWTDADKTLTFNTQKTSADVGTGKSEVIVPAFDSVSAGAHKIVFVFRDKTVEVPVYVWASIETTDVKHVVGSSDKTIAVSDEPVIKVDDKEVKKDGNWSFKDEKLTFNKSYLDSLTAGDHKLSFSFDTASGTEFVGNLAIINVTPVEANKDNKWLNSNTALSYNASHAVTAVSVKPSKGDVKTLTKDTDYSVSDKNVLSLKAAFLKQLPYGEHTMTVSLNGETVTVKFTTAPSLVPKDATNHTKGGQKDLVFIASDKMDAVWVGQTKLKTDYYTISSDGKTITLKAAFLNTLKADTTYTITTALMNADGKTAQYSAATSFKIISAATAGATPGTGDSANFGLWIALLVISGAAIAVILPKKHKEN